MKIYNNQNKVLAITIKGYQGYVVNAVAHRIVDLLSSFANKKGVHFKYPALLPDQIFRHSIHSAPFKHKVSFEHSAKSISRRLIYVHNPNSDILNTLNNMKHLTSVSVEYE